MDHVYLRYLIHPVQTIFKINAMKFDDINKLTHKIGGCIMEVHNQMGNGFQEVVYQRALSIEFGMQELSFVRELGMPLEYKGKLVGSRRVDFFAEN